MKSLLFLFETKGRILLVLTFLISVILNILGSFQLTERLDSLTADIIGGVYGPFYGWGDRVGQKQITVLLVDRQTLDDLGTDRWPPDYTTEADFAEWAAAYHPAAIFMDFYYTRARRGADTLPSLDAFTSGASTAAAGDKIDRAGIADLAGRLERIRRDGISVFIGPVSNDPDLAPLAILPQAGIDRVDLPRGGYPLKDAGGRALAAFQLYDVICARTAKGCSDMDKELGDHLLAIQWGFGASAEIAPLVPKQCRGETQWRRTSSAFKIGASGLIPALDDVENGRSTKFGVCSYADAFPIRWLQNSPPGFDPKPFIEGRVVLIGSNLNWLADYVNAPLLGSVPGVMAHAMALDNLLQSGARAARYSHDFIGHMTYRDLVELILEGLGLVAMVLTNEVLRLWVFRKRPSRVIWWAAQLSVVILVPGLLGLLMSWGLKWPAVNVISISAMGLWALFLLANELYEEAAEGTQEKAARGKTGEQR